MAKSKIKRPAIDSKVYRQEFYGILNAAGDFWTPLAFESEAQAWHHIQSFWGRQADMYERCRRDFKIVPVRVRIDALPASVDRNPEGEDRHGLRAQHESAVPKADAQTPAKSLNPGASS